MGLKKEYKMLVDGRWLDGNPVPVISPYTGKEIAIAHFAAKKDVEHAIASADKAFEKMRIMPSYRKREILLHIADGLKKNLALHSKVLSMESGKALKHSIAEVERAISTATIAAEEATRMTGDVIPLDITRHGERKQAVVRRFPIGVVAGISPFNFPLNLAMHKIAPAIASGNTIVHKPASKTPLSLLLLAEIIQKSGLPDGAVNIIPAERDAAAALIEDERIKLISFTGSPAAGWEIKKNSGKKKVLLELGGNAGVIVHKDAKVDDAVAKVALGAYAYQGQVCISVQRAFIHAEIYEDFIKRLSAIILDMKIGDPLDPETDFSVMIDEKNAKRIESWVGESEKNGASIIMDGKRKGSFYPPTIIEGAKREDKVSCLEAFAPILVVHKYRRFEDAIEGVNDSAFGLQAGVFTNDFNLVNMAFERLEVGGVIINDVPTFRVDNFPYGGVKDSGLGREGVKYTIMEMTEPKVMVHQI